MPAESIDLLRNPALDEIVAALSTFPQALRSLVEPLPPHWLSHAETPGAWNTFQVVAHLVKSERANWIPRIEWLLRWGETRPFEPFERTPEISHVTVSDLLNEFENTRSANLVRLSEMSLRDSDMARAGLHPALGRVELGALIATWPAHDLTHLHQISRTLASQLRAAVGPWSRFLGVLQCNGHSE